MYYISLFSVIGDYYTGLIKFHLTKDNSPASLSSQLI